MTRQNEIKSILQTLFGWRAPNAIRAGGEGEGEGTVVVNRSIARDANQMEWLGNTVRHIRTMAHLDVSVSFSANNWHAKLEGDGEHRIGD